MVFLIPSLIQPEGKSVSFVSKFLRMPSSQLRRHGRGKGPSGGRNGRLASHTTYTLKKQKENREQG